MFKLTYIYTLSFNAAILLTIIGMPTSIDYVPLPDPDESPYDPDELGYDPRPEQMEWFNTPIPRVNNPLPGSPELTTIASSMWWNGAPWTILRNRYEYLRHAIDYATDEQCNYLWDTLPREDWTKMLRSCRPGQVSTRAWRLWCMLAGLEHVNIPAEWHRPLHLKDRLYHFKKKWPEKSNRGNL